jgi:sporulation protein YlmC with PRC-barrel domain
MNLVRDVLDTAIVDRAGREMGRVDSVVLERRGVEPPIVIALDIGPAVLGQRLHPALGRWIAALEYGFGVAAGRPVRIPAGEVIDVGERIVVSPGIHETAAGTVEDRLRARMGGQRARSTASGDYVARPLQPNQFRLDRVLGRQVRAANNRSIGRLEEIRAARTAGEWIATDCVIGAAGVLERVGIGLRVFFGRRRRGTVARWDQIEVSGGRLRLTCPASELRDR